MRHLREEKSPSRLHVESSDSTQMFSKLVEQWWNIGGTFVDRSEPRASIHMFSSIKWSPSHRHVSFGRVEKMYRLASFCPNSHVFFKALCWSIGSHFTTTHRQC